MSTVLDLTEFDQEVEGAITNAAGTEQPSEPDAGSLNLADDSAGGDVELRLTIPTLSTKLNILGVERSPDEMAGWSDDQIREVTFWAEAMDRAIENDPEGEMPGMPEWMAVATDVAQDAGPTPEATETPSEAPDAAGAIPEAIPDASTAIATSPRAEPSAATSGRGATLAEVKASIQTQMVEKLRRLRAAELLYEEAKEEAADRKKAIKAIQRRLNQLVQDLSDCEAGTYQQLISGATAAEQPDPDPVDEIEEDLGDEFDEDSDDDADDSSDVAEAASETQVDPAAEDLPVGQPAEVEDYGGAAARAAKDPANHTSVREIGLTESQFEKLGAHEPAIDTVADLERAIREGYLQKVKGVGPAAVDKITDKLMTWRVENPIVA